MRFSHLKEKAEKLGYKFYDENYLVLINEKEDKITIPSHMDDEVDEEGLERFIDIHSHNFPLECEFMTKEMFLGALFNKPFLEENLDFYVEQAKKYISGKIKVEPAVDETFFHRKIRERL